MRFGKLVGTVRVGVAGAVLAVALAGCTEPTPTGKLPDPPSSTATSAAASSAAPTSAAPTTSATPTTTYTPEEQAVIDQYQGYFEAFHVSGSDAVSITAAFEPYVAEPVLDQVIAILQGLAGESKRPGGTIVFGSIAVTISGSIAHVVECRDTSTELMLSTVDGAVIGHGAPGTHYEAQLEMDADGRWLVWQATATDHAC